MADSEDGRSLVPLCSLTDDDVDANSGLANLLTDLRKHIDYSGMSITLALPLQKARNILQAYRASWLKSAILHWCLQEILKPGADHSVQDKKFLGVLEQQLLVTELKWMVTLRPSVLGLETQHLTEFLPPHQDLEEMQKKLPDEVGKFLKAICLQLLGYCNPDSDKADAAAQMVMFGNLAEHLTNEKQLLREAGAQQEELKGYLNQKKAVYFQVLLHCLGLLKQLVRKFRLEIQSNLDQVNTQYFEVKCSALFLKLRAQEMKILLETYTPEILNVHRMIRDKLQSFLMKEKEDIAIFHTVLLEYEILGLEFKKVVEEYTKLHEKIKNHRWMLAELSKY